MIKMRKMLKMRNEEDDEDEEALIAWVFFAPLQVF